MLNFDRLKEQGRACGFTHVAPLDVSKIELMDQVREMCEKNTCQQYGKNWCCPPAIGTVAECAERVGAYRWGILVQTVGEMEDSFDAEAMMETAANHRVHFERLMAVLEEEYPGMLSIGAGTCTKCKVCTYPDAPCRFPGHTFGSMEGYGMLVTQVCQANDLDYYYGANTIAYTSCFLLE